MSEKIVDSKKPEDYFFRASAADFKKVPGSPIAYWVRQKERELYSKGELLRAFCSPKKGLDTGENEKFLRLWYEVSNNTECLHNENHSRRWYPYNKGGDFRKWYGNREYVINWGDNGKEIKSRLGWKSKKPTIRNPDYYFRAGFTWTTVSSGGFSARYCPEGALFDNGGCTLFAQSDLFMLGGFANSKIMSRYLEFLSPTLNFQAGDIGCVLFLRDCLKLDIKSIECVKLAQFDWNSNETSWDFTSLPLLQSDFRQATLKETYQKLRQHWFDMTMKMQQLEEENNRIFIEAYGLQDELTPDVPLKEITLTCNPHYRYGGNKTEVELETLLQADTMKEFMSYAIGCMFGRYSLDKEGLILANQGETLDDYLKQVPEPTFMPDDDNVIPVLDGEWFTDDVTERFRRFVKVTFGDEYYQENLAFIEQSIGKDIRKYFLKDFYADHVKRYKKRPIYWMFSSPKGSFNALIYMHRYQPTTASVVLNGYLREFRTKLIARKEHLEQVSISVSVSQRDKTNALKEIEKLKKMIDELEIWMMA